VLLRLRERLARCPRAPGSPKPENIRRYSLSRGAAFGRCDLAGDDNWFTHFHDGPHDSDTESIAILLHVG